MLGAATAYPTPSTMPTLSDNGAKCSCSGTLLVLQWLRRKWQLYKQVSFRFATTSYVMVVVWLVCGPVKLIQWPGRQPFSPLVNKMAAATTLNSHTTKKSED
ncbi:hypothetical protein PHJA_000417000 [Phtheirospermum japonicum]|uniref:Uncharacterized protein n=1 Tax=Phtheirospermum japonicum TaxID=374723 RepID=A0A830BBZ2_9LAMI|nr:hypothetical protein PHJA_000417000 [Phtheirospermum japonicum]